MKITIQENNCGTVEVTATETGLLVDEVWIDAEVEQGEKGSFYYPATPDICTITRVFIPVLPDYEVSLDIMSIGSFVGKAEAAIIEQLKEDTEG
jgi:hypothetical protein